MPVQGIALLNPPPPPPPLSKDPTADIGQSNASEVKGQVTTDPEEIGEWIRSVASKGDCIGVIFGTYQSSHRIAEALTSSRNEVKVMVADEAHRTAGIRRIRRQEDKLRDFTVCHDNDRFPAKFRVYQTATPKVYGSIKESQRNEEWIVRNMDDEDVFGVELYRKSYAEAIANGWLTDYRIIAIGVNDKDAYEAANELAEEASIRKLSTAHFIRGLALALVMAGGTRCKKTVDGSGAIHSSISFMNEIIKSKTMVGSLNDSLTVRDWLDRKLAKEGFSKASRYKLEHLDASDNVTKREAAKAKLASATADEPYGIINVGIFGEGTDAPSLSAVGFLEPRRSPVDVIQAVGRVMRRAPGKKLGYIVCPLLIPPNVDAEKWLQNSSPEDGWKELGEVLLALRAHDSRIEKELEHLMEVYLPPKPNADIATMVCIGIGGGRVRCFVHMGPPGMAERDVERVINGTTKPEEVFRPLEDVSLGAGKGSESNCIQPESVGPHTIISGKRNPDGSTEIRLGGILRDRPKADGTPGPINIRKSKKKGRDMVNGTDGSRVSRKKKEKKREDTMETQTQELFERLGDAKLDISINLLAKSGLARNRMERDVNIIQESILEARYSLFQDELGPILDRHFRLDALKDDMRQKQADGCTIACLLLMNAAMLHQRIAHGGWLPNIDALAQVKNAPDTSAKILRQWNRIARHDFLPVMEPAIAIIEVIQESRREEGLNRALRHLASQAELVAESYADLGADHAGPLFNKVMGNQASDGAFFTRPPAASILARLSLDALGEKVDWTKDATWKAHRAVDLACGSGTLLTGLLTAMKHRAQEQGADPQRLAELQKLAVEEVLVGLDINPVSLQLAAAQLTAGNSDVSYRQMRLYKMAYGAEEGEVVRTGSLELLGEQKIVPKGQKDFAELGLNAKKLRLEKDNPLLEDAVDAALGTRMVMMNPPFSNRTKMGEKFPSEIQRAMRQRIDSLETLLVQSDPEMDDFVDKNSIRPLFVALADQCLDSAKGLLAMINPTIAFTAPSGLTERIVLAKRFHIHTLLTCHQPGQVNLSQNTSINESIFIARRHEGPRPTTRIISLDRFPRDDDEVADLHRCLLNCRSGLISGGWGEVSQWPAERIEEGDWSAAVWRSSELAEAAFRIASDERLPSLREQGMAPAATGRLLRGQFKKSTSGALGSFPILKSKGTDAQIRIEAIPDEYWLPKELATYENLGDEQDIKTPGTQKILQKAGYLLITAGQDSRSARLTAVASRRKYVGNGWMPVSNVTLEQAMAAAVAINSTIGRLQIMRNPGRKLEFPAYSAEEVANLRLPDLTDKHICRTLAKYWELTVHMEVPQFRKGECEVRRLWDEAVAEALKWDLEELTTLRKLLHREPHVRGLGYGEYG